MNNPKLPLSVLILSRNEASQIERAVRSAQFAADVVVIDACSTDNTQELAKKAGARVIERAWTNFSEQRNFSLQQAQYTWVMPLDADEAISPVLVEWLRSFFSSGRDKTLPNGYRVKRAEYFLGERIFGACWNPSFQDRLFRKDKAKYVGLIHEYPEVEGGMDRAPEEAFIEHNPQVTVESFLEKMNRYTTIEAFDRFHAGQRTSLSHLAVVFFATWWKNFFYYKGYRDGMYGFVICLMEAVSRTVRHLKLWQIQEMHRKGRLQDLPSGAKALELGASLHRRFESRGENS